MRTKAFVVAISAALVMLSVLSLILLARLMAPTCMAGDEPKLTIGTTMVLAGCPR